jgi:PAS domain S-box-containing protein
MMLEDIYRLLRSGHVQAQGIVDTLTQPLLVLDQNLGVVNANNAFIKTFEVERDEVLGQSMFSLGNGNWDIEDLRKLVEDVIPKAAAVIGYEVTHDFPGIGRHTFSVDAQRLVHPDNNSTNILVVFEDVTERHRIDAEKDFTISETRHRMKNLLAVVRAVAMQTETEERTAEEYRNTFLGRLEVALRAQDIVAIAQKADFATLLQSAVGAAGIERVRIQAGPSAELSRSKVVPASMIFHELTTNALKYGALSVPEGEVHVTWRVEPQHNGRNLLICEWRETNGPPVQPPAATRLRNGAYRRYRHTSGGRGEPEVRYRRAGGSRQVSNLSLINRTAHHHSG